MAKLHQEIENIFRFRILSNDEIPSYMKRMSALGKIDEVAKQALMNLILTRLGEIEDNEDQQSISKEYIGMRYAAIVGDGSDGPLIIGNDTALQEYEKPVDVVQTGTNILTVTEESADDRKARIKRQRVENMAKAREARAAKKTLK